MTDVTNATKIFGRDIGGIKGKNAQQKPVRVETELVHIPQDFHKLHKFVALMADVMFLNGVAFLSTFSRNISLMTTEYLPSRTVGQLADAITKVIKLYRRGGFIVRVVLMDMEFEKVADQVDKVEVNTTAAREQVPEKEQRHRVIKERARGLIASMP